MLMSGSCAGDIRCPIKLHTVGAKFLPARKFISIREEIYFYTYRNFLPTVCKFSAVQKIDFQ